VGEIIRVLHRELPGWPVPLTVAVPPRSNEHEDGGDDDDDDDDDDGGYLHVSGTPDGAFLMNSSLCSTAAPEIPVCARSTSAPQATCMRSVSCFLH
jgi:hypothetical protein